MSHEATFFIRTQAGPEARTLHPARFIAGTGSSSLVELLAGDRGSLRLKAGGHVVACFYRDHKFMEQQARIESCAERQRDGATTLLLALAHVGDPIPAESRQCFRVSTVAESLSVTIGGEDCPMLDVSVTGLSVISRAAHAVGENLAAVFTFEEKEYTGTVSVQSARPLGARGTRYGLSCIGDRESPDDLSRGLRLASMALQRAHLQRLARMR